MQGWVTQWLSQGCADWGQEAGQAGPPTDWGLTPSQEVQRDEASRRQEGNEFRWLSWWEGQAGVRGWVEGRGLSEDLVGHRERAEPTGVST